MSFPRISWIPFFVCGVALVSLAFFGTWLIDPPPLVRWAGLLSLGLLLALALWSPVRQFITPEANQRTAAIITLACVASVTALSGGGMGSLFTIALVCPLIISLEWFGRQRTAWHALLLFGATLMLDILLVGRAVSAESTVVAMLVIAAFLLVAARAAAAHDTILPHRMQIRVEDTPGLAAGSPSGPSHVRANPATHVNDNVPPAAGQPHSRGVAGGSSRSPAAPSAAARDAQQGTALWTETGARLSHNVAPPAGHVSPGTLGQRRQQGSRQWWRTGAENRLVAEYLLDVRASTGADEAVVWLLRDGASVLRPIAACSSSDWPERSNADEKWMAIVRWSCEAEVVQVGQLEDGGGYATAPLAAEGKQLGVLCLRRQTHFDEAADELKSRVGHHAALMQRLVALIDVHGSSTARSDALDSALDAVRELQDHAPVEQPSSAICDAILQVCGCDASALVRWHPEVSSGSVEAGAGPFEMFEQSAVQSASIVGSTCQRATPFRLGASRDLLGRACLFREGEGDKMAALAAISIQPLKRDGEVIGALVAAWNSPTDLVSHTAPSMEVLASVAGHALQTAWRLEAVQIAARTDALTGLSNRRYLDEQVNRVLAEAGRYGDPASLILLDLDYFKNVNDTYGHAVGDMVLKHVAETLLDGTRGVDLCARYGGEELAVLLPHTAMQGAVELAERLRVMVESRPLEISGASISITASFGVTSFPAPAPSPEALLTSADVALYRAKEAGRNRVRTAQPAR